MKITIPGLRLESEANKRDKWAAVKRAKDQRIAVGLAVAAYKRQAPPLPLIVTIVRVAPRLLDDDNLARACKAPRDSIAEAYGVDDKPRGSITWRYWQRKGKQREYGCELLIEPRTDGPRDMCDEYKPEPAVAWCAIDDGQAFVSVGARDVPGKVCTWMPDAQQLRAFVVQCETALAALMEREQ